VLLQFLPLLGFRRRRFDAALAVGVARAWDVPGAKVGTAALTTEVMVLATGGLVVGIDSDGRGCSVDGTASHVTVPKDQCRRPREGNILLHTRVRSTE